MLHASNGNRGLVDINEANALTGLFYTLSDALGNTSRSASTVQGAEDDNARWNI